MTLKEAMRQAAAQLAADAALAEFAARDAELLMMHVLSAGRASILANPARELSDAEYERYAAMVRERGAAKPIQYILGETEFYGLPLRVTPAVLIPRPETEHLVEAVLARVSREEEISIADVGTGSGAIAIALAVNLPKARVTALEISDAAMEIARENAQQHGVAVEFLRSDLLGAVRGRVFDVIAANPPYIATGERETLHPQVREYEPAAALFAGATGMEIYERLVPEAWTALKPGGWLVMEMGAGQRDAMSSLLRGWDDVEFVADLQGIPRVAVAKKSK